MKPSGDPEQDGRKRRPIPWPRHVEITAILAVVFVLVAVFYVLFGSASEDLRRVSLALGYEDSYARHCKVRLTYYLKTHENLRIFQKEGSQDVDPHDVRLAYDAQDPSGATVRGEFRCLYRPGSAYSSEYGPRLDDVEVDGTRLSSDQVFWIERFWLKETQQDR